MRRKHRHELKQNEFLVWMDQFSRWFLENRRSLTAVIVVVVVAALVTGGLLWYREGQRREARALLTDAMSAYHGHIVGEDSAVKGGSEPVFGSAQERYQAALDAFQKVVSQYPRTEAGRQARYYTGLCLTALGRYDEAVDAFEKVRSGSKDLVYFLATQALAAAKAEKGDSAEAIELYRQLLEDPANPLPKDYQLFEMAKLQEQAGNLKEARQSYERLLEEFPDSQLRGDVRQRSELLEYRLSA